MPRRRTANAKPAQTASQTERAYRQLHEEIITGQREPGTRLVEARLAEELNVSRTPVREALRRLVADHLVSRDDNGGLSIHRVTPREIEDTYVIREVLDGLAARLASRRISDSELMGIAETIQRIDDVSSGGAVGDALGANITFHDILYDVTGNEKLIRMGRDLRDFVKLVSREPFSDHRRAEEIAGEHRAIVAALLERDADAAEQAAREHVRRAREHLIRQRISSQLTSA
jgi:DNA-binding GntR family transcriptional regulator